MGVTCNNASNERSFIAFWVSSHLNQLECISHCLLWLPQCMGLPSLAWASPHFSHWFYGWLAWGLGHQLGRRPLLSCDGRLWVVDMKQCIPELLIVSYLIDLEHGRVWWHFGPSRFSLYGVGMQMSIGMTTHKPMRRSFTYWDTLCSLIHL